MCVSYVGTFGPCRSLKLEVAYSIHPKLFFLSSFHTHIYMFSFSLRHIYSLQIFPESGSFNSHNTPEYDVWDTALIHLVNSQYNKKLPSGWSRRAFLMVSFFWDIFVCYIWILKQIVLIHPLKNIFLKSPHTWNIVVNNKPEGLSISLRVRVRLVKTPSHKWNWSRVTYENQFDVKQGGKRRRCPGISTPGPGPVRSWIKRSGKRMRRVDFAENTDRNLWANW